MITCSRYHDFSAGHRVYGHEGKCRFLHGHNYRVHFKCRSMFLDEVGRVIDFSCIKQLLCQWLEENWDHKFLIFKDDPIRDALMDIDEEIVVCDFNPTAENMANYLLHTVAPILFKDEKCTVIKVTVEETRKCSATAYKD